MQSPVPYEHAISLTQLLTLFAYVYLPHEHGNSKLYIWGMFKMFLIVILIIMGEDFGCLTLNFISFQCVPELHLNYSVHQARGKTKQRPTHEAIPRGALKTKTDGCVDLPPTLIQPLCHGSKIMLSFVFYLCCLYYFFTSGLGFVFHLCPISMLFTCVSAPLVHFVPATVSLNFHKSNKPVT